MGDAGGLEGKLQKLYVRSAGDDRLQILGAPDRPETLPAGKVLTYEKSNLDGSGAVEVALYLAAPDRFELLESLPSGGGGLLMRGEIDWSTGSPRRLEWWFLGGGERQLLGTIDSQAAPRTVRVELIAAGRPAETEVGS